MLLKKWLFALVIGCGLAACNSMNPMEPAAQGQQAVYVTVTDTLIVGKDTLIVRDTVKVRDTVVFRDTILVDTLFGRDTIIVVPKLIPTMHAPDSLSCFVGESYSIPVFILPDSVHQNVALLSSDAGIARASGMVVTCREAGTANVVARWTDGGAITLLDTIPVTVRVRE